MHSTWHIGLDKAKQSGALENRSRSQAIRYHNQGIDGVERAVKGRIILLRLMGTRSGERLSFPPLVKGGKVHEIDEAKRILLRQGRKRFGRAKVDIKARIEALSDLNRLEQLVDRVLDATSWDDLTGES